MNLSGLFFLYLLGSFYSVVSLVSIYPFRYSWWVISGDKVYIKNMEKIGLCMHPLFGHFERDEIDWLRITIDIVIAALLSWVGLYNSLLSATNLLKGVFHRLFNEPDSAKQLLLPLRTDSSLEGEVVWARCFCFGLIVNGITATEDLINRDLEAHYYLDRDKSLTALRSLGVYPVSTRKAS